MARILAADTDRTLVDHDVSRAKPADHDVNFMIGGEGGSRWSARR